MVEGIIESFFIVQNFIYAGLASASIIFMISSCAFSLVLSHSDTVYWKQSFTGPLFFCIFQVVFSSSVHSSCIIITLALFSCQRPLKVPVSSCIFFTFSGSHVRISVIKSAKTQKASNVRIVFIGKPFIALRERRLPRLIYREDWAVSYLPLDLAHSLREHERLGVSSLRW